MTAKTTMRTIIAMPPTTAPAITGTGAVTLFSLIATAKKINNYAIIIFMCFVMVLLLATKF